MRAKCAFAAKYELHIEVKLKALTSTIAAEYYIRRTFFWIIRKRCAYNYIILKLQPPPHEALSYSGNDIRPILHQV